MKVANEKRLIDANALLCNNVWLCGGVVTDPYSWGYMDALDKVEIVIRNAPTVEAVEVVYGRWLFDSNTERCFCSACNEEALYTSKDDPIFDYDWEENLRYSHTETILEEHLTNYCPNCGAKMDGDGND